MDPDIVMSAVVRAQTGLEGIIPDPAAQVLSQSLLGIAVLFLVWLIGRREQELKDVRSAHRAELAEKDKLILELQESRLVELKAVLETVSSNTGALMANKSAIDGQMPVLTRILEALQQLAQLRGRT